MIEGKDPVFKMTSCLLLMMRGLWYVFKISQIMWRLEKALISVIAFQLVFGSDEFYGINRISTDTVIHANLSTLYSNSVDSNIRLSYVFGDHLDEKQKFDAIRVHVSVMDTNRTYPVLFVVERQESVLSWQVPIVLSDMYSYSYHNVSRTLCPETISEHDGSTRRIIIDVSTMALHPINFSLRADAEDIDINNVSNTTVSPAQPQYFKYTFPKNVQSVVVKVESSDELCSILSVQEAKCPVYDMVGTADHVKYHQTITRRGAITIKRDTFDIDSFFIVLVVKSNDLDCQQIQKIMFSSSRDTNHSGQHRVKTFTSLKVEESISQTQFIIAVLAALSCFLGVYFIALVIGCICQRVSISGSLTEGHSENSDLIGSEDRLRSYGTVGPIEGTVGAIEGSSATSIEGHRRRIEDTISTSSSEISVDDNDFDTLPDIDKDKEIVRTKTVIFVSDLAQKPRKVLSKKYNLYVWNLITLAIFYVLPVIQLVIAYQTVVNKTGDQDVCFYNFYCARSLGFLTSFNNVFSNIGYVMLGLLFIVLVYFKQKQYNALLMKGDRAVFECGIPQHFGVFYAMGIALCMEGLLSACYHVCPSYSNFQFDTAFMYMIGWLCMLKIYQTRHQDINAHAHTAYCSIAVVVLIGVIGVTGGNQLFWIIFVLVYVLCSFLLSIHVYYMGRWSFDLGIFRRLYVRIRYEKLFTSIPLYIDRMGLLVVGNFVNWGIAIFGALQMPRDFASFLLAIVIINLLMYFIFYITMKLRYREKILLQPLIYIISAAICWSFALYFFLIKLSSWQVSPAISREKNEECVLLKFYDSHDVWHFLSATSLFLSFMILLTLEDDLKNVPRDKIRVF